MPSKHGRSDNSLLFTTILSFAHLLRRIGIAAGPGSVVTAVEALQLTGLQHRDDIYWALHAIFVRRPEEHPLFDRAFHTLFNQTQFITEGFDSGDQSKQPDEIPPASRRVQDALRDTSPQPVYNTEVESERSENTPSWSARETLPSKDFADGEIRYEFYCYSVE